MEHVIYNPTEKAFWSNELGWGSFSEATRYTTEERNLYCFLPGRNSQWLSINAVTDEMKNQEI
jgi:hypothetical protein